MKQSSQQIKQPLLQNEVKPEQKQIKVVSFFALFRYADSKDKIQIFFGILAALAAGTSFPFFMIFFGDIVTVFIPYNRDHAANDAFEITLKFLIIGGATWLLNFIGLYCWNQSGSNQSLRFKKLYYQTLLQQQIAWYDSNDVNKLATQVATNISHIQGAIGQKVFLFISTTTTSLFGFVYAYIKCWQLSLALTLALPLLMIAGVLMMKSLANVALLSKTSYEDAAARAEQAFGGIKTIKSLVGEIFEESLFVKALDKGQVKNRKTILAGAVSLGFVMLIFLGLYAAGFWISKKLIIDYDYLPTVVIGTFFCFIIGGSSVGQISPIAKNFAQGKVAVSKLYQLMQRKKTLIENVQNAEMIDSIDSIQFKNVSFAYKKVDQNQVDQKNENLNIVLDSINLKVQKNQVNALVGESGSGKSTISQLLMRYYDPISGQILINKNKLDNIDIGKFRQSIGYVGQQPVLFAMSIEENIKLANPKLTKNQIIQILKKANAWEFISKLQKGLQTYVGTNGTQLSGGQKQRIAIARAIAKKPQILILDEATSALDRKNQKQIQQTLKNLTAQKITTLVIAHRLSTIKNAQKITVLSKGKIVQQGHHEQLLKLQGLYYTLVKSQIQAQQQQPDLISQNQIIKSTIQQQNIQKQHIAQTKPSQAIQIPKQKLDSVFSKLFKLGSSHNFYLFIGVLFAFINGGVWPFFNYAFSNVLALMANKQLVIQNSDKIDEYCMLFGLVAIVGGVGTMMYKYPLDIYGQKIVYDVRKKLFNKLLRLPVSFYDKKQNTPGAISTKIASDAYQLNNMISGFLAVMCMNLSTVSISLAFAFYHSWLLTLIVLAISPLIMISGAINMKLIKRLTQKTEQTSKFIGSLISDSVVNMRTVKSFGNNQIFLEKYSQKLDELASLNTQKSLKSSFFQGMGRGMIMIVQGLTFWIAGFLFQQNMIQDGQSVFIAIFSIIFAAMGVGQNSAFMPDMAKAKIAGVSIFDILESKDESVIIQLNGGGKKKCSQISIKGTIQFKNVTFKYPQRESKVLQNFSYKIQSNSKIAFVGPSGSGKSTIVQLIQRFYPLQSGSIQINGQNIQNFQLYSYRRQIGYVSQQPTMFVGTVKQNIKYDKQYTQQKIDKYSTVAHAKRFIDEWDQKYEKDVGNKGSEISGGQKQRLALVRALIRNPNMCLFDEATSALDMDTEKVVFENLKSQLKGKTSISIAHRLATIEDSDRIIVMREGKIIQEGKYNQLMDKKEHFYRLAKGE